MFARQAIVAGKTRSMKTALLGAAVLLSPPSTALAQSAGSAEAPRRADPVGPEGAEQDASDIIVTAQRRAERLQDVPIAISAIGPDTLTRGGAASIADLQGSVPGLTITGSAGLNATNLVSMRGIAGQGVPIGANQATAIYLDGVYLSKPDAGFFGLQDVERVEVLRGPQGTLYGRNATAGAINIITRAPGRTVEGKLDASYGNYDGATVGGFVSGPIASDFVGSVSGSFNRRDGYFRNSLTGNDIGRASSFSGRGKIGYLGSEGFDALLSVDYTRKWSEDLFTPSTVVNGRQIYAVRNLTTNIEDDLTTRLQTGGVALTVDLELSPRFTVTSVTSYREFEFLTVYDIDGSAARLIQPIFSNDNRTFNQEVRGVYDHDALRFTVGANYFSEEAEAQLIILPSTYTRANLDARPTPRTKSDLSAVAAFGQLEYDLTDTVTVVGGLRINHEKRDFSIDYSAAGAFAPINGEVSDTAVLPAVGINYEPSGDVLIYAKASQGYQSPGFAWLPGAGNRANTFGAETLWAYEAGVKSQFLNRAVTLNLAGFYYDYRDIQLRRTILLGITTVENAGTARVRGVEGELVVRPVRGLTLNAQATYLNAEYTSFCETITAGTPQNGDPPCTVLGVAGADRRGNRLNEAPRWSGGVGATYEFKVLDDATVKIGSNYSWETTSFFNSVNELRLSTNGWHRLDARASLGFENGLEVFAFGRNLTDERHPVNGFRFGGIVSVTVNDPRVYGAGLSYSF
ncbi:TonB-dependent receptor [uncultured Sphingomonas sp.]|uniref:TonB-dependent receptor n=1 Tax=uncultured Sphingomonas sp. TaxID=158754 RepID=UPI0035CBD6A0